MNYIIYVNILICLLDVTILALEFADPPNIQTAWKPLVYSIKLKLEFGILNRPVDLTRGSRNDSFYTRSHPARTNDVALEMFNSERQRHMMDTNGEVAAEYEVRVGKGENNHAACG